MIDAWVAVLVAVIAIAGNVVQWWLNRQSRNASIGQTQGETYQGLINALLDENRRLNETVTDLRGTITDLKARIIHLDDRIIDLNDKIAVLRDLIRSKE